MQMLFKFQCKKEECLGNFMKAEKQADGQTARRTDIENRKNVDTIRGCLI